LTRRRLLALLAALMLAAPAAHAALAPVAEVLVVLSREHDSYTKVVEAMRAAFAEHDSLAPARITAVTLEQYRSDPAGARRAALVVTVGTQAARELNAAHPGAPMLHTLIPRQTFLQLDIGARESAIYLDQPFTRQLELVHAALPKARRIGAVLGPTSQSLQGELAAAARAQGFRLDIERIATTDELLTALNRALEDNDALLSVADPAVFNSSTVHHVLLTTYRYQIPVIGLSRTYVEAGALLAVYSTPEQIGRQLGELVATLAGKGRWTPPPPQYPRYYSVAVNDRVATSLGLRIEPEEQLLRRLQAGTGNAP
jgi:ABC-type uncharacterized transport system substrate-binding protein